MIPIVPTAGAIQLESPLFFKYPLAPIPEATATPPPIPTHFIRVLERAFAFNSVVCGELQNVEKQSSAKVAQTPRAIMKSEEFPFKVRRPMHVDSFRFQLQPCHCPAALPSAEGLYPE